jgi:hypothetical protein
LLVSSISPSLAYSIGQGSVVNSLAFFPTLTLWVERGAAAAKTQRSVKPCVCRAEFVFSKPALDLSLMCSEMCSDLFWPILLHYNQGPETSISGALFRL